MIENLLLFGNKSNLPENRDENKLYFCSDTKELFKGQDLYTEAVRVVDTLPENMAQGVLYVLPSGEVKVFNGTDVVTVAKPYVTSVAGTLSAENTDNQVPTAKVVYDSIVEAIGEVVDGGELVNNVISTKAGTITVAKGAYTQLTSEAAFSEGTNYFTKVGESYVVDQTVTAENFAGKVEAGLFVSSDETDVALKGVVVNPSYDATTRTITLPYADGTESLVIGLGKDIFVDPTAENKYNAETGNIELFLNDSSTSYKSISFTKELNGEINKIDTWVVDDETNTIIGNISESIISLPEDNGPINAVYDVLKNKYPEGTKYYVLVDDEYVEFNSSHVSSVVQGSNKLYAALSSQTKLEIPASELVDIYTGAKSTDGSATVAVSEDNVITASVNVSAEAGNGLSKKADGLFVDTTSAADFKAFKDSVEASLDDIDSQLNGEEIVLKEAGAATDVTYVFDAKDTVVVDGVETEVADQSALDTIVADENVSDVVVMIDGTEDRIAANTQAIAKNAEDIAKNADAIAALEAKKDIRLDETADNKYNAETGKVELFLNDGGEVKESVAKVAPGTNNVPLVKIKSPEATYRTSSEYYYSDEQGNDISSQITADNFAEKVAEGLWVRSLNNTSSANDNTVVYALGVRFGEHDFAPMEGLYYINSVGETVSPAHYSFIYSPEFLATGYMITKIEATKVEVDMAELASEMEADMTELASKMEADMAELASKMEANETFVDPTANNKFNAETGKIELFLNDDGIFETKLGIVNPEGAGYSAYKIINPNAQYMSRNMDFNYCDEELNDITSEVTADNFAEKVAKGLWVKNLSSNINATLTYAFGNISSLPNNLYYQNTDGEVVLVSTLPDFYATTLAGTMRQFTETVHLRAGEAKEPTKIEVDMSELSSKIEADMVELASKMEANETFVDPTANNKFNAETGKVELFLNDSDTEFEAMTINKDNRWYYRIIPNESGAVVYRDPSTTDWSLVKYYDSDLNDITSEVTADNFAEKIAEGLWYSDGVLGSKSENQYPESSKYDPFYMPTDADFYFQTEDGEYVKITEEIVGKFNIFNAIYNANSYFGVSSLQVYKTLCTKSIIPATKIEVDMSELTAAIQWGTF